MPTKKAKKGFSLVELLVAITILGIVAGGMTVAMVGQGKKARDAQRKTDLQTIKKAYETAKNDCANASSYPIYTPLSGNPDGSYFFRAIPTLRNAHVQYLKTDIHDPRLKDFVNGSGDYQINRAITANQVVTGAAAQCVNNTTGQNTLPGMMTWVLRAKLENASDPTSATSYAGCADKIALLNNAHWRLPYPASGGDGFYYVCSE